MLDALPWLTRGEALSLASTVLPKLFAAIVVFLAFFMLLRVVQPALRAICRRAAFAPALIHLLVDGLVRGGVLVLGLVMAASQLGIEIAAALAALGVLGIAVGFAAQETIANMTAGFLIFLDRPFKVGDWVTTQERYGEVRDITLRITRIRTLDNTYVVIPNKQIIGELLINHSMSGETRVIIPIGIACKVALDRAGIEIPFPHLQLFVDDVKNRVWDGLRGSR